MAGVYIHIPFCKQACHYCNFHFATSLRHKNEIVQALLKEIDLRREYFGQEKVETIYFGGGTPSLLPPDDLAALLGAVHRNFEVDDAAEITLEANPDDLSEPNMADWKKAGINRLSIGVQSFRDGDLQWMNRVHNAKTATGSLQRAIDFFDNITVDLIYGLPHLTNAAWRENVEKVISLKIPHLSCYALTVEPQTPLQKLIQQGKKEPVDPDKQAEQLLLLMQWLGEAGYEQYEISNFALQGFRSRHNSSYWQGRSYLGIGPSAHSFDGKSRQWNVSNNRQYTDAVLAGKIPFEKEILTTVQQLNEYIMTSLRTSEGLSLERAFGQGQKLLEQSRKYLESGLMKMENQSLILTNEGKLLADGIAAELFFTGECRIIENRESAGRNMVED